MPGIISSKNNNQTNADNTTCPKTSTKPQQHHHNTTRTGNEFAGSAHTVEDALAGTIAIAVTVVLVLGSGAGAGAPDLQARIGNTIVTPKHQCDGQRAEKKKKKRRARGECGVV